MAEVALLVCAALALIFLIRAFILLAKPKLKCLSFDCSHNGGGFCLLDKIAVYDNMVKGLCLFHSQEVSARIAGVFDSGVKIGRIQGRRIMVEAFIKWMRENNKILEDPTEFEKWMERHWQDGEQTKEP